MYGTGTTMKIYIVKDDPKPAVFIARKLFGDFSQLADRKIDFILSQETKDKSIFTTLESHNDEDPTYGLILEALGTISEFCLPSLLKILIEWYHHQLGVDANIHHKRPASLNESLQQQQLTNNNCDHQMSDCGSPICNDSHSANNSSSILIRSPTPSSPDTCNQISITSTLPLDYQSPSLTVISEQHSSSAVNTSTSTATNVSSHSLTEQESTTNTIKRLELVKTRKLLIEYTFCQCLIEVFQQLYLHPGNEDLIGQIEDIAFEHFKCYEGSELINPHDIANVNQLADKYAQVIGVLAQTRFKSVRKRFISELNDLRIKEPTPYNIQCIVTLLSGIKFFRVKMAPIEEFEASFQFLQECADYFIEVRHKSIKHALASLFVEIMNPLASIVKNEVKIPCLKNFVDTLWAQTLDMCSRKKHSITLFPLVTCLLCVSQRSFFLTNWGVFLNMCLSNLKNRDQKMCRVALESLYRLIWIYMIRVKCESNNVTQSRLQSIVDALFPRGNRSVVPRDAPLNVFVDIIQFIAQERLDFAMRNIIFDLLSVDRPFKVILAPERMNIALQAFLLVADTLQQKEGDPPMPKPIGEASSLGKVSISTNNYRRTHMINKMLNDDAAKSIGLYPYYSHIQKSFNDILKALDTQFGKPLLLTTTQNTNKEADDIITSERKPKIELFKTCVAAIPRLMPDGMSRAELIDLLSRMTVHIDEEMRKYAFESLQTLITDFADWRLDAIEGFASFLVNNIDESLRHLVDNALRMMLQFLISWRSAITPNSCSSSSSSASNGGNQSVCKANNSVNIQTGYETISSRHGGTGGQIAARKNRALAEMRLIQSELSNTRFDRLVSVIQKVEAASFFMLCNFNQPTRRLASHILRESRSILKCYSSWNCMEQLGFKSPDELGDLDGDLDGLSVSLRGSLSADNLSRITTTSIGGPVHSSVTSMNNQTTLWNSVSKMCISGGLNGAGGYNSGANQSVAPQNQQHDLYDSDIEQNLTDCYTANEDNFTMIFWLAVIMLESDNQKEYMLALRLLQRILPNLPFEQPEFMQELERNLHQMKWYNFPGLHELVLRGCSSSRTYEISIVLLDQLTPILRHPICSGSKQVELMFPFHVMVLLTQLLCNYEDPTPFCMNIARRIAIWCEENSSGQKLENLSTVMMLYSRRCFSKDGFQWIKCVVKYLYDAYPSSLPQVIPILVDMLESGPKQVQALIAPILYCIMNYVDVAGLSTQTATISNADLERIYSKYLELAVLSSVNAAGVCNGNNNGSSQQWRDAVQIFKLIISRSSYLATNSVSYGRELPGRTMDFGIDVDCIPVIAKTRLSELGGLAVAGDSSIGQAVGEPSSGATADLITEHVGSTPEVGEQTCEGLVSPQHSRSQSAQSQQALGESEQHDGAGEQGQSGGGGEQAKWHRSWLARSQIRGRLVSLLMS